MSTTGVGSSNLPINSLIQQPTSSQPPASSSNGQLGENDFLTLLTTQLQNQDPLSPMDDTQSVAQLAQFSSLQEQTNLATSFQNFQSNFGVLQTSTLIGKTVTVETTDGSGNSSNVTGTVNSVAVQNGSPFFTMTDSSGNALTDSNGKPLLFSPQNIVGIG